MGRDFRTPKTNVICRQVIAEAHHDRFPVSCMKRRAGEEAVVAPNLTQRQVGVEAVICLPRMDVIELPWEKLVPALMRGARSLAAKATERVARMLSRRALIRSGLLSFPAVHFGGRIAAGKLISDDNQEVKSPPTRPFVVELPIIPVAQAVPALNPAPDINPVAGEAPR